MNALFFPISDRVWSHIKYLDSSKVGQSVLVRGRLHASRATGNTRGIKHKLYSSTCIAIPLILFQVTCVSWSSVASNTLYRQLLLLGQLLANRWSDMHQSKSTPTFISNLLFVINDDSIYKESIVDLEGTVSAAPEKITGCSQQDVELVVNKVCQ